MTRPRRPLLAQGCGSVLLVLLALKFIVVGFPWWFVLAPVWIPALGAAVFVMVKKIAGG